MHDNDAVKGGLNAGNTDAHTDSRTPRSRVNEWLTLPPDDRASRLGELSDFIQSLPAHEARSVLSELAREGQDSALPLLSQLLNSPEHSAEAVEALGFVRSQDSVRLIQELNRGNISKPLAKAARRSLHRLKSQGFEVEETGKSPSAESMGLVSGRRILRSLISTVGASGNQILSLLLSAPLSGTEAFEALADDTQGLLDCASVRIPRRDYEEHLGQTPEFITLADAPAEYVLFRLREYERITLDSGRVPPSVYQVYRNFFHSSPREYARPLVYEEIPPEAVSPEWCTPARIAGLLEENEFGTWILPQQDVEPYVTELKEIEHSPLVLAEATARERIERYIKKVIAELFPPEIRALYKRRLEESAYVMLHTGRREIARTAVACALHLASADPDSPPGDFAEAIVKRTIGYLLMASDEQEEGGLIQTARSWELPRAPRP